VEGVAADPNYRFIVTVKGPIPHEFSPEPTCHVFGSNLVANCAEYYGSAGSPNRWPSWICTPAAFAAFRRWSATNAEGERGTRPSAFKDGNTKSVSFP
jgi:hypothetical protein